MKTKKSKIDGVGIIPLRCEICYGSIEDDQGMTPLLIAGAMHFVHTNCFNVNEEEYIIRRIKEISEKTRNDSELFDLMEEGSAEGKNSNKDSVG